jgi:hypothetical protein
MNVSLDWRAKTLGYNRSLLLLSVSTTAVKCENFVSAKTRPFLGETFHIRLHFCLLYISRPLR